MPCDFYISAFHPKALNVCWRLAGLLAQALLPTFPFVARTVVFVEAGRRDGGQAAPATWDSTGVSPVSLLIPVSCRPGNQLAAKYTKPATGPRKSCSQAFIYTFGGNGELLYESGFISFLQRMRPNRLILLFAHLAGWLLFFSLVIGFVYRNPDSDGLPGLVFSGHSCFSASCTWPCFT